MHEEGFSFLTSGGRTGSPGRRRRPAARDGGENGWRHPPL